MLNRQPSDLHFMDVYSRQIGTFGLETMMKLTSLRVLIVGLRGVGIETAKNLALAGVHSITLHDNGKPQPSDLGVNFALSDGDVAGAKSRAELSAVLVSELNKDVRVKTTKEDKLTEQIVSEHDVVIFTDPDTPQCELIKWNDFCRGYRKKVKDHGLSFDAVSPIGFIYGFSLGPIASVFVDFGSIPFIRKDPGSHPLKKMITEVQQKLDEKTGEAYTRIRFTVPEGSQAGALPIGAYVSFSDVKGMVSLDGTSINDLGAIRTAFEEGDPCNTVRIAPTGDFSPYEGGGFMSEVHQPLHINFRSLAESLLFPKILQLSQFFDQADEKVVLTTLAIMEYVQKHGRRPAPNDSAAAQEVLSIAKVIHDRNSMLKQVVCSSPSVVPLSLDAVDETFVTSAALLCGAELQPVSALIGAIVAQEVVKFTGKYTPIEQFFSFHCMEALPSQRPTDVSPQNSRYDHLIAVFGSSFVQKLQDLNMFLVGCGALGCEYLKNFALLGIACGKGQITVTDNDRIEFSNLSRQFLFREENVGHQKSAVGRDRALRMNPKINIVARQDFVGETTEHIFDDDFWAKLDLVCNALDNIPARLYVDGRCILFEKILIEAGTQGTGGNTDIVVPKLTMSYADGGNADESGGIPMCTLRNFPYLIEHCIEWSRALFEDVLSSPFKDIVRLQQDGVDAYLGKIISEVDNARQRASTVSTKIIQLQKVLTSLKMVSNSNVTVEDCVTLAWGLFYDLFRDRILSLIECFPADAVKPMTEEEKAKGNPPERFWSGHRKFPKAVAPTTSDHVHLEFLISATNLFACALGVHPTKHDPKYNNPKSRWMSEYRDYDWIRQVISKLAVPSVTITKVRDLSDNNTESSSASVDTAAEETLFKNLCDEIRTVASAIKTNPIPVDFEKDDDDNFHIDFISAAANIRASNYHIKEAPRHEVKMIAGRIIPAIATTTAAVTGLALLEMFKALQQKSVDDLRTGQIDLGANTFTFFSSSSPALIKSRVNKTYDPNTDYTLEENIVAYPNPHTKYDKIYVDVSPNTTVVEFGKSIVEATGNQFKVTFVGIGRGETASKFWDGASGHKNANAKLKDVIESEGNISLRGKKLFNKLVVMMVNDDYDDIDLATVVLRFS